MKHFPVLFLMLLSIVLCFCSTQAQTVPNVCQAQLFLADINTSGRLVISGNSLVFIEDLPAAGWFQSSPAGPSQALIIDRSIIIDVNAQPNAVTSTISIQTKRMVNYQSRQEKFLTFRLMSPSCSSIAPWLSRRSPSPSTKKAPLFKPIRIPASYRRKMLPDISGVLVIEEKMITFDNRRGTTFRWDFRDIKELERRRKFFFKITPYSGSSFEFDLYGNGLSEQDFRDTWARILQH